MKHVNAIKTISGGFNGECPRKNYWTHLKTDNREWIDPTRNKSFPMGIQYVWKGIINVCSPDIMYGTILLSLNPRSLGANPLLRCSPGFQGNWFISVSTLQKTTSSQQTPRQSTYRLHKTLRFVGFRFPHPKQPTNVQNTYLANVFGFRFQFPVGPFSSIPRLTTQFTAIHTNQEYYSVQHGFVWE